MMNAPLFPDAQTAARFVEDFRGASLRSEEEDLVDPAAFVEGAAPFAPLLPDASWLSRLAQARRQCADDCWQPAMALATFDFRGALERVSCPVLMLAGSQSPFRPFLEGRPATSGPAEVSIVPDARFSISWEKAELVAARIVEFEERNEEILQQDACGS